MSEMTDQDIFKLIVAAYTRGVEWHQENQSSTITTGCIYKSAYDYADKTTSIRLPPPPAQEGE